MKFGCGGFVGLACPGTASCSYRVETSNDCNISDASGHCWMMPNTCVAPLIGPTTRACSAAACTDECSLIKQGASWYVDTTCPQ